MAVQKKVEIVTVGAGWTGSILAYKLASAGHQVVSLEQGPMRWANPDFEMDHDELRYNTRTAMMVNLAKESWSWRPSPQAPSLPIRQYGNTEPGQGLGGAGVHWSAMLWRFTPYDFKYRSYYIEKYGEKILPPDNAYQDWPLTYEEMEPYYDEFEYAIGASGATGNLNGAIIPGGNPFEAPRSRPYPNPPLAQNIPSDMFAKAARDLGYHPFPQPSAILSQGYTDPFGNIRSGCIYCGYCTRYGCEVDAKASPIDTYIPAALKTGRYQIRPNSKVLRINIGKDGLATGVTYIDANGQEQEQPADLVLLTGFTLTNVKLLLISRSKEHPNGIGGDRGQLGRNAGHQILQGAVTGVFPGRKFNLFMGNSTTMNALYDFYGSVIDHTGLGFVGGAQVQSAWGERTPIASTDGYPIGQGKTWGMDWKNSLRDWDATASIYVQAESPAYKQFFYDLDPTYKDSFGQPLLRWTLDWTDNEHKMFEYIADKAATIMERMGPTTIKKSTMLKPYTMQIFYGTHNTGGAIMGANAGDSVCNSYGQVWDTPNVFAVGACLFPQNDALNPTDTIGALSLRTGDAIRDKYFAHPGELIS
ncbi:MAG: GMC family oxidoreductase [Chloroflexota bacterium]|nr:GMC family oxidoreductase [Chloroflexota bacterium]